MAKKKGIDLSFSIAESEALTSIRNLTSQVTTMNKELNLTNTVLRTDSASIDTYKNKLDVLSREKEVLSNRVRVANDTLEKAKSTYGENSTEVQKWQNRLLDAQIAQQKVENQIEDTTKAIDEYGKETVEASEKTSIFGDVLKANLASDLIMSGVKSIVNGVKAIGKVVGDVIGDSIKAYADYEQLIGGVETLFKDSADIVSANAQQAYRTAGVSANKYMEQATSFSATLLQGLDGDTAQAAKYADLAITDMADNANKMGTDISSIQNAYQGFAKDNYTMLDNLKLGYGGTAGEMARLINDSGVMGDSFKATAQNVKEIPFNKMIQAIHDTQVEMDITGTTAKEASETISGSLNSVKASWENVLSALASGNDEMLTDSIDGILEGIGNLVTNVVAILPNIIEGLGKLVEGVISQLPSLIKKILPTLLNTVKSLINTLITILPELIPVVIEMMNYLVKIILENLPLILEAGIQILLSLIEGIADALPDLIPAIVEAILLIVDTLLNNIDLIITAGVDILVGLITGIIYAIPKLIQYVPQIIIKLVSVLISQVPRLLTVGVEIIAKVIAGIVGNIGKMWTIGKDMVAGIWEGISNSFTWIKNKISGWIGNVTSFIKKLFGIKSPSTLMKNEVGLNLGLGVAEGITDSVGAVNSAMSGLQDSVISQVEPSINIGDATADGIELGVGRPLYIQIAEFNNNREQDIETLAEELAYYLNQKELS